MRNRLLLPNYRYRNLISTFSVRTLLRWSVHWTMHRFVLRARLFLLILIIRWVRRYRKAGNWPLFPIWVTSKWKVKLPILTVTVWLPAEKQLWRLVRKSWKEWLVVWHRCQRTGLSLSPYNWWMITTVVCVQVWKQMCMWWMLWKKMWCGLPMPPIMWGVASMNYL